MAHITVNENHLALKDALVKAIEPFLKEEKLSTPEVLAVTAQVAGILVSQLDARHYDADRAFALIAANIEIGNRAAVEAVFAGIGTTRN